jgi:hypothetical protein
VEPRVRRELRVLDFDIETRRIGFHNGGRFNPDGCEPVIIAAAWHGEPVEAWGMGRTWSERRYRSMIKRFRILWDEADCLTGHYIRKFDLVILNGAMLENGFPPLSPKPTIDTKLDLLKVAGLSASQENLASLRRLEESKFHMSDNWWRKVARLTPEGLALAERRVVDDVIQHQALRESLSDWLKPPREWRP